MRPIVVRLASLPSYNILLKCRRPDRPRFAKHKHRPPILGDVVDAAEMLFLAKWVKNRENPNPLHAGFENRIDAIRKPELSGVGTKKPSGVKMAHRKLAELAKPVYMLVVIWRICKHKLALRSVPFDKRAMRNTKRLSL